MVDAPARTPRSAPRLIGETFQLYWRYPLLFLILAAGVLVPYHLIVLAATGVGPFNRGSLDFGTSFALTLIDWILIGPLVSALHVWAVADLEEGIQPHLRAVAKRGLRVLPIVAAAAIMSGLGMLGGLILLVFPGAYLWLRWHVVAQAAAIEHEDWRRALRRSWSLTEGNVLHVLFFVVCISLIGLLPIIVINHVFQWHSTTLASFLIGSSFQVLVVSFTALSTALLYFDLRARRKIAATDWLEKNQTPVQ